MPHLAAFAGTLIITFSAVFVRLAQVSPATSSFFRTLYALLPLLILRQLVRHRDLRGRRERLLAFAAGVLLGIDLFACHTAIEYIGAGLGTVLANTQVIFVGLMAWIFQGERPKRAALAAVPAGLMGVAFLSGLGQADAYGKAPMLGVVFGLLTGISYAAFLLVFRASNRRLVHAAGPLFDATAGAAVSTLILGLAQNDLDPSIHWPAHGWLVALSLGSQVAGWLLISSALPRLPSLECSVLLLMQPLGTVFWAWLIFAERLSQLQWIGAVLVLACVGTLSIVGSIDRKA